VQAQSPAIRLEAVRNLPVSLFFKSFGKVRARDVPGNLPAVPPRRGCKCDGAPMLNFTASLHGDS
jgi:hypothetical protein